MRTGCWSWIVILSKKRIPVKYLKILSQYTVKITKIDWQRFETFCPRKTSDSFDKYGNKQTCTWSSWQASLPFEDQRKKDGSDCEPDNIQFSETPASHWRANSYSALSFDRKNFFNMVHLHFDFTFVLLFVSQLKDLFSDACQMTVKSFVLHFFPVSLTKKPYNKHLISLVFRSVQKITGPPFFHRFMPKARAINRWKKSGSASGSNRSLCPKYVRNSPKVIFHISKPKGSLVYYSADYYTPNHGQPCHYYNLVQLLALSQMRFLQLILTSIDS